MSNVELSDIPCQVWGYYHPFYGTPEGPTGRWLTWNEPLWLSTGYGAEAVEVPEAIQERLGHNPEEFLAPGRRSNYSAFYPTLGLYDCLDPGVLEQHARWAVEASLDGLMWDYMLVGEENSDKDKPLQETIYDRSFRIMLEVLERLRIPLLLCPWYDSFCWYGFPVEKIAEHLGYLVRAYHGHPHVLHFDNRLVVYSYNTLVKHSAADWRRVRALLAQQKVDHRIFLVAGEVAYWKPDLCEPGLFDGFSQYNYNMGDWSADGVSRFSAILRELAERNGSAFWSATVGPGFDGRIWHHPGRAVARGLGKLYEALWEAAIAAGSPFITICSFNEWGEGTQIEPCLEYEDLYLQLTAKWARIFKGI
ncbi:MAG: hypothetical protein V1800_08035 [Candidatus Latescibacterota bacterium]